MNDGTCGKWMPRKKTRCARGAGHVGDCQTAEVMERARRRQATKKRWLTYDPVAVRRWNRTLRLARYGLTEEQFKRILEDQGSVCGMCHEVFKDGQAICVDHDHKCCPGERESCGKCVRGLLCLSCNTVLGHIERRYEMARTYLDNPPARELNRSSS